MSPEAARLADLAARVADGATVDWDRAEQDTDAEGRRLVRHLRLVDSISGLYRSIPDDAVVPELDHAIGTISGEPWGPLVILEALGRGASCEVMRAFERTLHREVALKLFHPGDVAAENDGRGLAEARRLARIRHGNVVQVYGVEQHEGRVGIWMELIRGDSLDAVVRSHGRLSGAEAAVIGQQLCQALSAVHAAGLVHRDIKAQNVMREVGGRIVLMDFGTGQELRHGATPANLAGTPLYLAPEIVAGRPATVRSDVYSLAVLLYYLVTGEFPIAATTFDDLRRAHTAGERRRLLDRRPDLPAGFVAVVERGLASDPADRFPTAGEFGSALHQWTLVRPAPPVGRGRPSARTLAAAMAVAGLVAVGGLARWPWGGPSQEIHGVAVLPLDDLSSGRAPSDFAGGLHDQLIATLGEVSTLRVPSRTSSIAMADGSRTVGEIARALKVDAVVEGTVTMVDAQGAAPPRARLNVRLIAAGADGALMTRSFEGPIGDALRLQQEAALAIAEAVHAVRERQGRTGLPPRGTEQAAADAYFQGRVALTRYGGLAARQAIDRFTRAVTIDPSFAAAYAGLARAHVANGFNGGTSQAEARAAAFDAATKAIAMDAELADAHIALGDVLFFYDWDLIGAAEHYRRALELNSSSADAHKHYADLLAADGQTAAAVREARQLAAIDPQSADTAVSLGMMLFYNREYAAATGEFDRALEIDGGAVAAMVGKGRAAESQRRFTEAVALTERAIQTSNNAGTPLRIQYACLLAKAGRVAEARDHLAAIEDDALRRGLTVPPEYRAYVHVALGENDEALGLLEEAVATRDPAILWMASDPRLDPVRGDPRFKALLARLP